MLQPNLQEGLWEALVQSQVRFNRVPEKVPEKAPEKVPGGSWRLCRSLSASSAVWRLAACFSVLEAWFHKCTALVQSQVRFNRVPEKVPEKGKHKSPCMGVADPCCVTI